MKNGLFSERENTKKSYNSTQAHSWTSSKKPVKVMDGLGVVLSGLLTMVSQKQDSPNFRLQFSLKNLVGSSISFSKAARGEMACKYANQASRALRQSDLMLRLIVLQVDPLLKLLMKALGLVNIVARTVERYLSCKVGEEQRCERESEYHTNDRFTQGSTAYDGSLPAVLKQGEKRRSCAASSIKAGYLYLIAWDSISAGWSLMKCLNFGEITKTNMAEDNLTSNAHSKYSLRRKPGTSLPHLLWK